MALERTATATATADPLEFILVVIEVSRLELRGRRMELPSLAGIESLGLLDHIALTGGVDGIASLAEQQSLGLLGHSTLTNRRKSSLRSPEDRVKDSRITVYCRVCDLTSISRQASKVSRAFQRAGLISIH